MSKTLMDDWRDALRHFVKKYFDESEIPEPTRGKLFLETNRTIGRYFDNCVREVAKRMIAFNTNRIKAVEALNASVSEFLYGDPPLGGFPDSSLRIGVAFEVAGTYEDWGFVVEQRGQRIAVGRTLPEALQRAREKLRTSLAVSDKEKCACGNEMAMYQEMPDGTRKPLCLKCFTNK